MPSRNLLTISVGTSAYISSREVFEVESLHKWCHSKTGKFGGAQREGGIDRSPRSTAPLFTRNLGEESETPKNSAELDSI